MLRPIEKKFQVVGLEEQFGSIVLRLREVPKGPVGEVSEAVPRIEVSPLPKTETEKVAFELLDAMKRYGVPLPTMLPSASGVIAYPQVAIWLSKEEYETLNPRIGDMIQIKMDLA